MNPKSFILFLYGIALFIILSRWSKAGGTGLPAPSMIAGPSYLYGVLALASDFLEGLPIVLAAGLTFGLYIAIHPQAVSGAALAHAGGAGAPSTGSTTKQVGGTG